MGLFDRIFGARKTDAACDLCPRGRISRGEGYLFYSATVLPLMGETGALLLCNECTKKYINAQQFDKPVALPSITMEGMADEYMKEGGRLQEANAIGIVALCKARSLSPEEAKGKAREFAGLYWQNEQKAIRVSAAFWTNK